MLDLGLELPMPTEADTCRTYVIPKLKSVGWEDDYISEQLHNLGYLDALYPSGYLQDAKINALPAPCSSGRLQSETQEKLDPLLPSAEGATAGRGV